MMRKNSKGGRNGFYHFMVYLKNRQGHNFNSTSLREVAEAAGPLWNNMSPKEKEPFENMARREKQGAKYTSQGVNIAEIEKQENEIKNKEQQIRNDTQKMVQLLMHSNNVATHFFYIIHINNFCYSKAHKRNYPAEIAISRFNLLDGVDPDKVFHRRIQPGPLPLGYSYEAKRISDETHQIPPPAGQQVPDNTEKVFNDLLAFLMETSSDLQDFPLLFAREKDLSFIIETLTTLALDFGQDENLFKVNSLEYFLFVLKNSVAENVWPALSLSVDELERDVYDYTINIACEFHQNIDAPVHCSKAIVTRLVYVICDNCCQHLDIELIAGRHVPTKAKLASSRSNTASYAPSLAGDVDSTASYRPQPSVGSDRCNSALSFVSTETVFDRDDFPALGGSRRNTYAESDAGSSTVSDWCPARKARGKYVPAGGSQDSASQKTVELPSALANRMEGLSIDTQRQKKGRGRGIARSGPIAR